jgi:hypothetical protein
MLIFLIVIVVLMIVIHYSQNNTQPKTCDQLKQPHSWVTRKNDENEYLVCEKCRILPSGDKEEG